MADNTTQTGSDTIATDDIGGIKYQRVKVTYGADGSSTDASTASPLPVTGYLAAGTNNIGDIDVLTVPAADRTTDSIAAALQTSALMSGLTVLTPKYAAITASASGVTTIVALVAAKKIRILSWQLVTNAAVNVKWQSHTTTATATGLHYFGINSGIAVPFSPFGHFETVAGEALDINLSGAVAVGGSLVYVA